MSSRKRLVQDLCEAAKAGRTSEVAKLLQRDPTIINEASQDVNETALQLAALYGRLDLVRCLEGGGAHELPASMHAWRRQGGGQERFKGETGQSTGRH